MTTWEIKEPLIVGEYYTVPCHIEEYTEVINDFGETMKKLIVNPLLPPHIHTIEHYHIDNRFVNPKQKHSRHTFVFDGRISNPNIEYIKLKCYSNTIQFRDGVVNEPVKEYSINNKCPHLGYDLSQIIPVNGVITCPMHGTRICNKTKRTLNETDKIQNR